MIFVYAESHQNIFKKSAFEALSFAKKLAEIRNKSVIAICINIEDTEVLKKYGADTVIAIKDDRLDEFKPNTLASIFAEISRENTFVISHTNNGSTIASLLAVKKNAQIISQIISLPSSENGVIYTRKSFSSKGIMHVKNEVDNIVLSLSQNAIGIIENQSDTKVENYTGSIDISVDKTQVVSTQLSSGTIDLKEAENVVSAGRGLKGPENWTMIEELAQLIGAATACSKPVSDIGWRPHSEHVGQTGKAISPNLYIAIGISGAIQHLAGVNSSKTIVVINTDEEAPFFKSADYGIVGDAFVVIPKMIEEIKKLKT